MRFRTDVVRRGPCFSRAEYRTAEMALRDHRESKRRLGVEITSGEACLASAVS